MGVARTGPRARPWIVRAVRLGRGSADRSRYSPGGIRQPGCEAEPPKRDFGGAGSPGLLVDDEMCASAIRHAPATFPRARSVSAIPIVLVGLRLSRARPVARLSGSHRRPPALPRRRGHTSFRSPGAVTDLQLPLRWGFRPRY